MSQSSLQDYTLEFVPIARQATLFNALPRQDMTSRYLPQLIDLVILIEHCRAPARLAPNASISDFGGPIVLCYSFSIIEPDKESQSTGCQHLDVCSGGRPTIRVSCEPEGQSVMLPVTGNLCVIKTKNDTGGERMLLPHYRGYSFA